MIKFLNFQLHLILKLQKNNRILQYFLNLHHFKYSLDYFKKNFIFIIIIAVINIIKAINAIIVHFEKLKTFN